MNLSYLGVKEDEIVVIINIYSFIAVLLSILL